MGRNNHLSNYLRTHSLSVMTTGRTELLEHGYRRRYLRGSSPFRDYGQMEQQVD
jgi:hypothetical protein